MTLRLPLLTVLLVTVGACEEADFDSRVELSGYRVIGIEADPPSVDADGLVLLRAHDFADNGQAIDYHWSLCLVDTGSAGGFACPDGLSTSLRGNAEATLDLGPDGLDLQRMLQQAGPQYDATGVRLDPDTGFDVRITLESGQACDGCRSVVSVKRIHVENGATHNTNPRIEAFEVEGSATAAATLLLRVETDTPEQDERYLYTWYSARGESDPNLTFDEERQSELPLPEDLPPGEEFELIVAVRDGRGGLAVARRTVTSE